MYLEQRLQMQEDEVQLLKIALADVLKRLNISEAQTAALTKRGPVKGTTLPHTHTHHTLYKHQLPTFKQSWRMDLNLKH